MSESNLSMNRRLVHFMQKPNHRVFIHKTKGTIIDTYLKDGRLYNVEDNSRFKIVRQFWEQAILSPLGARVLVEALGLSQACLELRKRFSHLELLEREDVAQYRRDRR